MIIPVNKKYRITSDSRCWQVEGYRGKRKGDVPRWEPISYHVEFKNALASLGEHRIRLIDSSVPDEIIAAIRQIKDEVISATECFRELVA
jgi:hypothetical protein